MFMRDLVEAERFWFRLIDLLGYDDDWYLGYLPDRGTLQRSAIEHTTEVEGVHLCFRWREKSRFGPDRVQVTITIENLGIERANNYLDQILKWQPEIEEIIGSDVYKIERAEDGVRSDARIIVQNVDRTENWEGNIRLLGNIMSPLKAFLLPRISTLVDLSRCYYYVIPISGSGDSGPNYKAGITVNPEGRFKSHIGRFRHHEKSSTWTLEKIQKIEFQSGHEAGLFEQKLLKVRTIRYKKIHRLSSELFLENPLEYARKKGWYPPQE